MNQMRPSGLYSDLQGILYLLQPRPWLHESRSSIWGQKESKHQSISAIPVTVANCMTTETKTWITVGQSELGARLMTTETKTNASPICILQMST